MRDASSPLSEFIPAFLASRRLAPHTTRDYERYLKRFDEFTGHASLGDALTTDNALRWQEQMKEKGLGATRNATAALKSFATWLARSRNLVGPGGGTVLVGVNSLNKPVRAPIRKPIDERELLQVWSAIEQRSSRDRDRARAYLRLLHATGLRKDDARQVQKPNLVIDPSGNAAWLVATARTPGGKPKQRRIRLDRTTVTAIQSYLANRPRYRGKPPEPLFLTEEGQAFTNFGFSSWNDRLFDDIFKATGWQGSADLFRATWKQEAQAEVRDSELRRRCVDLLAAERDHDRAVREACLVLEDRVRARSGATPAQIGTALMEWAFSPGRLTLASHPAEQAGVMQMYRGTIAFYRNGTGHRVRDDFDPKEAVRIVAWIDHLLGLLDR
jgi:uncharacterized protein (TIGR02391 family)